MFDAFVVTLREIAEVLLIVAAMLACLRMAGRRELVPHVLWGAIAGFAMAMVAAAAWLATPVDDRFEAMLTIVFAVGVALMTTGMLASGRAISTRTQARVAHWLEHSRVPAAAMVLGFAALAAFREGSEIFVFLRTVERRHGFDQTAIGALLGVLASGALVFAWRYLQRRGGLLAAFRLSALLLCLLSIELLLAGIADLVMAHRELSGQGDFGDALLPFVDGGRWYAWVCGLLMLPPFFLLVSDWWRASGRSGSS